MDRDVLTGEIIGAAIEVHRELGSGLLESAYEACLVHELTRKGLPFRRQVPLPVEYKDVSVDCGYRIDLVVDERVLIELKAVKAVKRIHKAQLLSYLRFFGTDVGLLINFNVSRLTDGVSRLIDEEYQSTSTPAD